MPTPKVSYWWTRYTSWMDIVRKDGVLYYVRQHLPTYIVLWYWDDGIKEVTVHSLDGYELVKKDGSVEDIKS